MQQNAAWVCSSFGNAYVVLLWQNFILFYKLQCGDHSFSKQCYFSRTLQWQFFMSSYILLTCIDMNIIFRDLYLYVP